MAEKKQAEVAKATAADDGGGNSRRKKRVLIGAGAALALLLLGVLGWVFLGGSDEPAQPAEAVVEVPVALYATLGDKFVVTLDAGGKPHFLQLSLSVLAREQAVIEELGVHAPLIRSRLVSLFGAQDFERLRSEEGKLALRAEVLAAVQEILSTETGKPGVEQVYFTDFVLQ
jgi:flagellar FliL protein